MPAPGGIRREAPRTIVVAGCNGGMNREGQARATRALGNRCSALIPGFGPHCPATPKVSERGLQPEGVRRGFSPVASRRVKLR